MYKNIIFTFKVVIRFEVQFTYGLIVVLCVIHTYIYTHIHIYIYLVKIHSEIDFETFFFSSYI